MNYDFPSGNGIETNIRKKLKEKYYILQSRICTV